MPPPIYSRQQLQQAAAQDAQKYGVGSWFTNQIGQESGWNPNAKSGSGAEGIAQFMPGTAKSVGLGDPYNPIAALDAAAKFDAQLLKRYGTPERALSAYNSGRPDAYKDPNFANGQTYNYVRSILAGHTASTGKPAPINTPGHAAAPPPLAAAATAPPPHDYRGELANELAAAAGTQSNDLSGFYSTLHKALQARDQAAVAPHVTASQPGLHAQPRPASQPQQGQPSMGGFAELLHEGVGGPTHSTGEHIHFAATDPQKELAAIKLAQSLGLSVRENPYTGDTVDPVHAKNSYHYRTFPGKYNGRTLGEAADASGNSAAMAKLYKLLGGK